MGAAQNQGIDAFFFQGSKIFAGNTLQLRTRCLPSLDVLDEKRARLLEDSKTRNCSKSIDIGFRLDGCLSSNHANLAIVRCNDSSTRGRGHDLNDGNVLAHPVPFPRVRQRSSGCGIACNDQGLCSGLDKAVKPPQRQLANFSDWTRTIGSVSRVPQVNDVLVWQLINDGTRNREST